MCISFECIWLQSQKQGEATRLPLELRPDKSKVVLAASTNPHVITATTMPGAPDAWMRPAMRKLIETMVSSGKFAVAVGAPASTNQIHISSKGIKPVRMTEPDETGMMWSIPDES